MTEYQSIDLGGYEGHFNCPNCGYQIPIRQGNIGDENTKFKCPEYNFEGGGCGKEWRVFAKEVTND